MSCSFQDAFQLRSGGLSLPGTLPFCYTPLWSILLITTCLPWMHNYFCFICRAPRRRYGLGSIFALFDPNLNIHVRLLKTIDLGCYVLSPHSYPLLLLFSVWISYLNDPPAFRILFAVLHYRSFTCQGVILLYIISLFYITLFSSVKCYIIEWFLELKCGRVFECMGHNCHVFHYSSVPHGLSEHFPANLYLVVFQVNL